MDIKLRNGSGEIIKKTYELTSGRHSQNFVEKLKHMISEKPIKETESMNGLFNIKTSSSKADMLLELKNLLSNGILTIDEFNNEKEKY